jgi:signal transduction histidine kinase
MRLVAAPSSPVMLYEFLADNRDGLIARIRAKVAARSAPLPTEEELKNGIPLFLDQLGETLRLSGRPSSAIGASAADHASDLLRMGFTVARVVYDYGDVCQAVTELAVETSAPITVEEFHILNRCIDDAIAEAVTEYGRQREQSIAAAGEERVAALAHELRNQLSAAMLAFDVLKKGSVGVGGSTGAVLDRSLNGMRDLLDRSFAEIRLDAPRRAHERFSLRELVEEIEVDATLAANARGLQLRVTPVGDGVNIEGDRQILAAAVSNLLQNAFKFSRAHGRVVLSITADLDRVLIGVEDECGGLPPGKAEELFLPYEQRSTDRSGLGLGLSISRKGVEANGGVIRVRDVPGYGCVFTIDLPRLLPS